MKQATVNGMVISSEAVQYELERLIRFYSEHGMSQAELKSKLPALQERAQEQAIGTKLLMDEAARLDLPVTDAAIDAQVERIAEQIGGRDKLTQALAAQKMTEADFRNQLTHGCRVDMLVERAASGVDEPTEADIRAYFDANKEQFATAPRVLAQHILITPDGDTETSKQEAHKKIEAIRERILGGANFEDEAKTHSACPSGKDGGSLGWFGRGMMVPEFDTAVFAMKVGEISDIIETQFGFHIIRKTDEEAGGEASFDEVHDQVRDLIRHNRRGAAVEAYVAELRTRATIEYK